jgi:hypothetical protein
VDVEPAAENGGLTAAGSARSLTELIDSDSGVFEVRTVTSWYVIDLDARALHRLPATIHPDDPMAATAIVYHFHIDGGWLPLVELHRCAFGERMRATIVIDGHDQPLVTTLVRSIRPYRRDQSNV